MLKRFFISNLLVVFVLNLLIKPIWIFFIDRNVQLSVGHTEYGTYAALLNLSLIFNIFLDIGITNYNNKALAQDTTLLTTYLPNIVVIKIILAVLYLLLLLGVGCFLQYQNKDLSLLIYIALVQILNSFLVYLRSNISAHQDFKVDSIFSVLDKFIMIVLCGLLLYTNCFRVSFSIVWFLYAQLFSYGVAIIAALIFIYFQYGRIHYRYLQIEEIIRLCKTSIPYALLILFMGIYMRMDGLLIDRLLPKQGAYQNGLYVSAYRILDACNMIGFLIAGVLLPLFSRMLKQKFSVDAIIKMSVNIVFPFSLCIASFCIVYAQNMMMSINHDTTGDTTILFQLLMGTFPAFCLMYIYSTLLTANGDILLLLKIAIGVALFNVILNIILIKLWMAEGAAISTIITEWGVALICVYICYQKFRFKFHKMWALKMLGVFLFFTLIAMVLRSVSVYWVWGAIIVLVLVIPFLLLCKIWDSKQFIQLASKWIDK